MKKLFLVILVAGAAWWYFVGGRKLTEQQVSDRKTATVDFSTSLDVAGNMMHIRARSTDTLIRRNGKVLLLRSEGEGSVGAGD